MTVVVCSGFPVPVSRYWREFEGVEISETELGIPGSGTVRRWLRESPEGFTFTLMAPKAVSTGGFKTSPEIEQQIKDVGALCRTMKARGVVFVGVPEFRPNRPNKSAVKAFVKALPARYPQAVLDLPEWPYNDLAALAAEHKRVAVAFDPLHESPDETGDFVYMRMPGPAGHRSRYDDESLQALAEKCRGTSGKTVICCFTNIDMHANAQRLRALLAEG